MFRDFPRPIAIGTCIMCGATYHARPTPTPCPQCGGSVLWRDACALTRHTVLEPAHAKRGRNHGTYMYGA